MCDKVKTKKIELIWDEMGNLICPQCNVVYSSEDPKSKYCGYCFVKEKLRIKEKIKLKTTD